MAEQEPVQEQQLAEASGDDEENENRAAYKPPPPKSVDEIVGQDQEDESLQKYKKQLLGDSVGEKIIIDENKGNVIVNKMAIEVEGREDIELDLTLPADEIKKCKIVLKEGCQYKVKIYFHVQREIVSGLHYKQKVFRKGITVVKEKLMVGSYGPQKKLYTYKSPSEDAPSGMLARGDYTIESEFTDDDKEIYLKWKWHLVIKKDFE